MLSTVTDDWSYSYTAQNRLSSVSLNGVEQDSYLYNFAGQQVLRTVWSGGSATRTVSVHDLNGSRLGEYDGDTGNLLREYIWLGTQPLAVLEGGHLYHLHTDHIDRPVMATDSTGTTVWQANYTPFGGIHQVSVNTGALTAQDLRFPGQWFQAETGLHQNWHRDYDPTTGRYLQADPLGLIDGPSVYGYALQSPVRLFDPEGLQSGKPKGPKGSTRVPNSKYSVRIDPGQPNTNQQRHAHIYDRRGCEVCTVNQDGTPSHKSDTSKLQNSKMKPVRRFLSGRGFKLPGPLGVIGMCLQFLNGDDPTSTPDEYFCATYPEQCRFGGLS